jgi:hypothetical protein
MPQYYYLISSLPMLKKDEKPLLSLQDFLCLCGEWLSDKELDDLKSLSLVPGETFPFPDGSIAERWYSWEINLRNMIAVNRAKSSPASKGDAESFIRPENDYYSDAEKAVQDAFSKANPQEREKTLDSYRWNRIEDLETGHIFDFERLCAYKVKLMLREKWNERVKDAGSDNFDSIVESVYHGSETPEQDIQDDENS